MRFTILLNAVPVILASRKHDTAEMENSEAARTHLNHSSVESVGVYPSDSETKRDGKHIDKSEKDHLDLRGNPDMITKGNQSTPWNQYTEGERSDWHKYLSKPGSNGTDDGTQFDWMKYAAPYMNFNGSDSNNASTDSSFDWQKFSGQYMGNQGASNTSSPQWNNGQGDGFGEPFRSQTGGDFRYKAGRQWGNDTDKGSSDGFDWQQFAAPYSNVNPSQPGTSDNTSASSDMDWHKYMSGGGGNAGSGGDFDWHQYADKYMSGGNGGANNNQQSSGGDWQQYASPYMGGGQSPSTIGDKNPASQVQSGPASGGYFEVEVSGTNLNVTTTFGLGQGRAANGTSAASSSGETGGGGGQQTFMTAEQGRIFLRGNFLNKLDPNVVPA